MEEAKLKKQEKAETSQFMEDLHLVFNGFSRFISLDFFKLATTLDPGGKHMGKNKQLKTIIIVSEFPAVRSVGAA